MPTWKTYLSIEKQKPYFIKLFESIDNIMKTHPVYPNKKDWFKALELTPFDEVKVVILGQDPYHQKHQAMGLSFSVPKNIKKPPSLINIFKELYDDLGVPISPHGDLTEWGKQGVLLLNTTLTVTDSRPLSHQSLGWEIFTDQIIESLNHKTTPVVFMLWGKHAQSKEKLIDKEKHLVLKAPHPSPLSAHRGFLGCKHFSKANTFLTHQGLSPINYTLPF